MPSRTSEGGPLEFWLNQLAGPLPNYDMLLDFPRPPVQLYLRADESIVLPPETGQRLADFCRTEDVPLPVALLAALTTLLARYTGQTDVLVGALLPSPVALRAAVTGDLTVRQLVRHMAQTAQVAAAHAEVSLETLAERLELGNTPDRAPVFQILLALRNEALERAADCAARCDVVLVANPTPAGLQLTAEYDAQLFEPATIRRWLGHLGVLLAAFQPQASLVTLPLLTPAEHEQLAAWNNTAAPYPPNLLIPDLIEAQAAATPAAIAIEFGRERLTYAQLNRRANRLAHHLQQLGLGPDTPAVVVMERSLEMVIGLLAVVKAGGAYLPIDPAYPRERVAFMLADAAAPVVLTQQRWAAGLPPQPGRIICLDGDWPIAAGANDANPARAIGPEHLAYIIYTSGSTGQPKGVMNTHLGLFNRLWWMQAAYQLTPADRVLQKTPFTFDVSVWEFFWPLMVGARLVVAQPGGHRDSAYLAQIITSRAVTTLHFVPSLLRIFLDEPQVETCRSLKRVICSGEALSVELQNRFFARLPGVELHNLYGPTEAAIDVTYWQCRPGPAATVPIGRPIANIQTYILDEQLQPVPVGVPGELHLGGVGLARGYLNRPELTQEKFIPHPFSAAPGARLYKTGDLARYRPDGAIEYLGRLDYQVKIRGQRVELGEIEQLLEQHPAVGGAVVAVRQESPEDQRLVAYLVPAATNLPPAPAELRRYLQAKLPDYMLPAAFVRLDAFPLTSSGKINRAALPAPTSADVAPSTVGYVAPTTPAEIALAKIWAEVLGVARVGIHDNFFALGGHSLLAARLAARLRAEFQADFTFELLLTTAPTVAAQARYLATARPAAPLVVAPAPPTGPLPLSFGQQRLWFLHQLQPDSPAYNIPLAVKLRGELNVDALAESLRRLIRRHEILRTTVALVNGQPAQIIAPAETAADYQLVAVNCAATEIEDRLAQTSWQPFDLAAGPLFRVTLYRLSAVEHVLLSVFHHFIFDGGSLEPFYREWAALYEAACGHYPANLPPAIQYADFAGWERANFQAEGRPALDYWRRQLSGDLPRLRLPTDFPRPLVQRGRGATQFFTLPPAITRQLRQLSRRHETTLFTTLLAAFTALLARYGNQTDVTVGFPVANRQPQFEALLGFLVNTLVFRADLSGNPSFETLLARSRQTLAQAYAHQSAPFEKLVELLHPQRDLSRQPLFQVMFDGPGPPAPPLQLPGIEAQPQPVVNQIAKFDLTVELIEQTDEITGSIEYDTDLFAPPTIARMIGHFQTLLAGLSANPARLLLDLPLLTPAEQAQLVAWNNTRADFPADQGVHQLFEAQVARSPQVIAVKFGSEQLTYAELNRRANRLAHALRQARVGPDVPVGLCLERSAAQVVGLLAILKAGGAYLPLDPAYPRQRLAFMLADSGAPVLLTQSTLLPKLPTTAAQIIYVDDFWVEQPEAADTNPAPVGSANNLAYVIYTSGSTGQPKGVLVPHRALVNHNWAAIAEYGLRPTDRALQFASISFDAAAEEIFPTLLSGATLVLRPASVLASFEALAQFVADETITVLNLPTSFWQQWAMELTESQAARLASVRLVIVGGEAAALESWQAWQARVGPATRWVNTYGPTEATIVATTFWPDATPIPPGCRTVPIGRPLANVQLYVLDDGLNPAPMGVAGQIYLGGVGLARGYLNRSQLTTERFIASPFAAAERLYQTGDVGRYLPDGNVEYLGRVDNQVKLRGFRVELGEIEAHLSRHPAVQAAVVLAREDTPGNKRLAAYIVPAGAAPLPGQLRQYLTELLPDYMIPVTFTTLASFPLTPHGKIDFKALPAPSTDRPELLTGFVPPRNAVERQLAAIWAEVLGVAQVGVLDNFFELGGHSLQVVQLLYRVKQAFGRQLSLLEFFAGATVANLARQVRRPALTRPAFDLAAEATLAPDIAPQTPPVNPAHPTVIFLTGAAGFLGTFLLADLLEHTGADIYCLIRAAGVEAGLRRIRRALEAGALWQDGFAGRIKPVPGDLAQPNLGLPLPQFQQLAKTVEVGYHCGAAVNLVLPYSRLKPANVLGTQEVLRLAAVKNIPVHLVSSLAVFDAISHFSGTIIDETEALPPGDELFNGYAQSKWVAEKLAAIAVERGLRVTVYRPGLVAGHSQTRVWPPGDYFTRFLKGCVQLGSMPRLEADWLLTPVDFVSRVIGHLSRQPVAEMVFHINNPAAALTTEDLAAVLRSMGYKLDWQPYAEWRANLAQISERRPDNALYPLLPLFFEPIGQTDLTQPELHIHTREPVFDSRKLTQALQGTGIACPVVGRELLAAYLTYFIEQNFLPPPG